MYQNIHINLITNYKITKTNHFNQIQILDHNLIIIHKLSVRHIVMLQPEKSHCPHYIFLNKVMYK